MFAIYAWMRLVDDIADEEDGRSLEKRVADLETWRLRTHAVLDRHRTPASGQAALARVCRKVIRRYNLPAQVVRCRHCRAEAGSGFQAVQ